MKNNLTKKVTITMTASEQRQAKDIAKKVLGESNLSGIVRYWIRAHRNKNRYFVISYVYVDGNETRYGSVFCVTHDGSYVNKKHIEDETRGLYKSKTITIVMLNIIEMTKEDFDCYIDEND